jgi:hypothetical protein
MSVIAGLEAKDNIMDESHAFSFIKTSKSLTDDQYYQIFTAILEGKYSWACILLLKFTENNPLDYIPERTYYRLVIKNKQSFIN